MAIIGGINRAARHGIVFRHGTALEQLGQVTVALFDKTGTLTICRPQVSRVVPVDGVTPNELLGLASGVEQGSGHLLARTVLEAAAEAAVSRLYGGIHYAFDNEEGRASGRCVGQAINERVRFTDEDDH